MEVRDVSALLPEPLRSLARRARERAYARALEGVQSALERTGFFTALPRWRNAKVFRAELPLVARDLPITEGARVAPSFVYHAGGPLPAALASRAPCLDAGPSVWVEDGRTGALFAYRLDPSLASSAELAALAPGQPPVGLSPRLASMLASVGAIVDPAAEEAARSAFARQVEEAQRAFRRDGFVVLRGVLPPGAFAGLRAYCRRLPIETRLHQDPFAGRLVDRNEPLARYLQSQIRPFVSRFVEREVAPTFTYSMWYVEGARLALHNDTPFCEYTLNFIVDQDPEDPRRWPLSIVGRDGRVVDLPLAVGDAVLFCGHELEHYRGRLSGAKSAIGVMCHFVDRAFPGLMVHFPPGKSEVPRTASEAIDHWTMVLRDHPEIRTLELAGHVDASERDPGLAERRAIEVKAALVARGADPSRLVTVARGADSPIAEDATKRGRAKNRRVVLTVRERLAPEAAKARAPAPSPS